MRLFYWAFYFQFLIWLSHFKDLENMWLDWKQLENKWQCVGKSFVVIIFWFTFSHLSAWQLVSCKYFKLQIQDWTWHVKQVASWMQSLHCTEKKRFRPPSVSDYTLYQKTKRRRRIKFAECQLHFLEVLHKYFDLQCKTTYAIWKNGRYVRTVTEWRW